MAALVLLTTLAACGGKKQSAEEETTGWEYIGDSQATDSTIYGICTDGTTMNMLQMLTDSGDTLTLSLTTAQEYNRVLGGIAVGDRMAVLANAQRTEATLVINQSTLMGEWVMPNPMDGSSEMGIYIKDGGIAESINMGTLVYQSWRLQNGTLEIVSTRDDGANYEEVSRYKILYLTSDSLSLRDDEGVTEYRRPIPDENYDDVDVDLDEGSFNDFVM